MRSSLVSLEAMLKGKLLAISRFIRNSLQLARKASPLSYVTNSSSSSASVEVELIVDMRSTLLYSLFGIDVV